jgi:hypothetical protein
VYEWYLPYDSLKTSLFPELEACTCSLSQEILVAGCGNSTLCEDLWTSGELMFVLSVSVDQYPQGTDPSAGWITQLR